MANQKTEPNSRQRDFIRDHGLKPKDWWVLRELNYCIFLKHRETGRVKVLNIKR